MGLQDLPEELLISIFNHLSAFDLNICQRTCRFINDAISNSVTLRYQVALEMYGMTHNPNCRLDIAECLRRLERHEEAWGTLTPAFTRTLDIENNVSGIYELSGGTYFLGASKERTIPFLRLPTDPTSPTHWDTLRVDGEVVDIGIALYEHDLFAAIVLDPSPIVKIKLYSLSTKQPHPLAKKHALTVQEHTVARLAVGVEITGDILVLVTREMVLDFVPDTVYVYNWKQGTLLKEIVARVDSEDGEPMQGFSGLAFLSPTIIVLPNLVERTLEIWSLDDTSTNDPLVSFDLPALKPGVDISHMACRGSPNPNAMSKDPDHAFHPASQDSLVIFHIHYTVNEHTINTYVFFVHRRTLLSYLPSATRKFTDLVPWEDWGPPNTFWMASGNIDWITTTSGQRHVMNVDHGLYMFDFNPIAVTMAKHGMYKGNGKVMEGELNTEDPPFLEPLGTRLPFIMNFMQLPRGINGVLMDEERIMCLKRNQTGRIAQIEMMYFG